MDMKYSPNFNMNLYLLYQYIASWSLLYHDAFDLQHRQELDNSFSIRSCTIN